MSQAYVQSAFIDTNFGGSIGVAFGADVSAGDLLICFISLADNSAVGGSLTGPFSVSDTDGNTWQAATGLQYTGAAGTTGIQIFWATAVNNGPLTVTATGTSGQGAWGIVILEYSGNIGTWAVDQTNGNSATSGTSINTGNITTLQPDEIIVACAVDGTGVNTAPLWPSTGAPFTHRANIAADGPEAGTAADHIVTSTGTYSCTFGNATNGDPLIAQIVSFYSFADQSVILGVWIDVTRSAPVIACDARGIVMVIHMYESDATLIDKFAYAFTPDVETYSNWVLKPIWDMAIDSAPPADLDPASFGPAGQSLAYDTMGACCGRAWLAISMKPGTDSYQQLYVGVIEWDQVAPV